MHSGRPPYAVRVNLDYADAAVVLVIGNNCGHQLPEIGSDLLSKLKIFNLTSNFKNVWTDNIFPSEAIKLEFLPSASNILFNPYQRMLWGWKLLPA